MLVEAGVDLLAVDTAHGHSKGVIEAVRDTKARYPQTDVVAGNVATYDGTRALVDAGVDGVKVGIGPGSICTTRVVSGVGVPQFSAILECVRAATPAVSRSSRTAASSIGDVVCAAAAGASTVMLGSLLAGVAESPGEVVLFEGRLQDVSRDGLARRDAAGFGGALRPGSRPRGIEVRARGNRGPCSIQRTARRNDLGSSSAGLRSGMGYVGARNLEELRAKPSSCA